jgi:hypothetical protein
MIQVTNDWFYYYYTCKHLPNNDLIKEMYNVVRFAMHSDLFRYLRNFI